MGSKATGSSRADYKDIPPELSFESIIKNQTAPPCSLNDYTDYLFHVEHNAEPLQFFLWYWDYIQRWGNLLPRQRALSPPWDPEQAAEPSSRFIRYSHKRERSLRMNKVLAILEMESQRVFLDSIQPQEDIPGTMTITSPLPPSSPPSTAGILSPTNSIAPPDWQPFTIQPNRNEVSRIARLYISPSAPRRLRLSQRDREACLRAVQHTTHPSTLLSAFMAAEAALRGPSPIPNPRRSWFSSLFSRLSIFRKSSSSSHERFVRWVRRNANPSRLRFLRLLGALLVVLGTALDAVLIVLSSSLSSSSTPSSSSALHSPYLRAICFLLWWPGLTVLMAAGNGVCLLLRGAGRRQVRPWESEGPVMEPPGHGEDGKQNPEAGEHKRTDTTSSTTSTMSAVSQASSTVSWDDPLRKPSLQTFGPANDYTGEASSWGKRYQEKGFMKRVFDETVVVQNGALMAWQDRTVLFAALWGAAGAAALTAVSLFIPKGGLF
ncbi:uncharacterized protein C8A04DRAFT_11797 [Dichotomopilus funicola]|uniref:RGS domain-containing protein n=1 Tax=Dichotomopilus funicola TaxID=1934379 RepID=A0AAN6ZN51_9PEZI|nr:hypothetical protein C8A04DRAFT_11797 [Dichotomopilus funicola]